MNNILRLYRFTYITWIHIKFYFYFHSTLCNIRAAYFIFLYSLQLRVPQIIRTSFPNRSIVIN